MTEASDVFLWYMLIAGAVFHVGGLKGAWEKYFVPVACAGEDLWRKIEGREKR
jgi:hypothetical protein